MDELLEQFVIEGRELAQQAATALLALEAGDPGQLDGAMRAFHTLKGSAGLFSFAPMESVLHAAEDLGSAIRANRLAVSAATIDPLLAGLGTIETWIETVAEVEALPAGAAAEALTLAARLRALLPDAAAADTVETRAPDWLPALLSRHAPAGGEALSALRYAPSRDCFFRGDDPLDLVRQVPGLLALDVTLPPLDPATLDPFACHLTIEALSAAPAEELRRVFRFVPDQAEIAAVRALPQPASAAGSRERSLRVDTARIDAIAAIAAELTAAKNRLAFLARNPVAPAGLARDLAASQAELDRLLGELHRAVSAVRMVRLDTIFQRLPLLVRETAVRLGRSVRLELLGGETEAEKSIADALFEPLLHTLRNAVDHGIERPPARLAAGKPREGRITVQASRAAGRVVIAIADDGAGIDPDAVRRAAVARQLVTAQQAEALGDAASIDLLFMPGFSTAATVSSISGRGVGLDAVRAALRGIGGEVDIGSTPGAGTTIRFTLPQTISVTTLIEVTAGGQAFGIPTTAVAETLRLPAARIAAIRDGAAFALRGATVPLVQLAALLGLPPAPRAAGDARVVVVRCGTELAGVEVTSFGERLEAVVQPPGDLLAGMPGLLGSVLTGDGAVLLALDLPALLA